LRKCKGGENIAFGSVKETKVAKELFSLCSISIFAAFMKVNTCLGE
jgi:hypothetical protein